MRRSLGLRVLYDMSNFQPSIYNTYSGYIVRTQQKRREKKIWEKTYEYVHLEMHLEMHHVH